MKTDVCHLDSEAFDAVPSLHMVERAAAYAGLDEKETLRLRLLGEELLGMMKGIFREYTADFWIESTGKAFELHLRAEAPVDEEKREALLSISSTGENIAARGFMGKIRQIFEAGMYGDSDAMAMSGMMSGAQSGYDLQSFAFAQAWSLMAYREKVETEKANEEAWDELEKSIVAKLADDVIVGVRSHVAEIIIKKKF